MACEEECTSDDDDDDTHLTRPFSRTTLVSWYQNVSILAFLKAKDDGGGDEGLHEQIKTLLFTGQILFLSPNQQCQSNEGVKHHIP